MMTSSASRAHLQVPSTRTVTVVAFTVATLLQGGPRPQSKRDDLDEIKKYRDETMLSTTLLLTVVKRLRRTGASTRQK